MRKAICHGSLAVVGTLIACCGSSDDSRGSQVAPPVIAAPPAPAQPSQTTAMNDGADVFIDWTPSANSTRYRVEWASTPFEAGAMVSHAEVSAPPFTHVGGAAGAYYYRVAGLNGTVAGVPGPVAAFPIMVATIIEARSVTPSVADFDGDGCLDLASALGDCSGGFTGFDLDSKGLGRLHASGRVNRDSRFADFNGDGLVDVFTNVYSPATEARSYSLLHFNRGGTFEEDPALTAMRIGGFGETVVVADFDNDGDLDLFLPHYWHAGDGAHNVLLVNDGQGRFHDVAAEAGLTNIANDLNYIPEGAQAIDFDEDGRIDIAVQSRLFINQGGLKFVDRAAVHAIPQKFDEGFKFSDADLDGVFDYVHQDTEVTRVHRQSGGRFESVTVLDEPPGQLGYGMNVCDVNGDGREDLVVPRNDPSTDPRTGVARLFLNTLNGFVLTDLLDSGPRSWNDLIACVDLDRDGLPEILSRTSTAGGFTVYRNTRKSPGRIVVRLLGSAGQSNQQGRVVRVTPEAHSPFTMVRVVESGSGYMAQGDYDILFAAPWATSYRISARFATGKVEAVAQRSTLVTLRETGEVSLAPL
jgi:hypothetical protein